MLYHLNPYIIFHYKFSVVIKSFTLYNIATESTHDRVVTSRVYKHWFAGIHRKGGGADDSYEIISIFIGILALLISFGSLIEKQEKIKMPILSSPQDRRRP